MVARFLLFSALLLAARAHAVALKSVVTDAEARLVYGDFFQSYRAFGYLEQDQQKLFGETGVEGFLKSLFVIGTAREIKSECDRLTASSIPPVRAKASYLCGLRFVETREPDRALAYLKNVPTGSKFHWPAQILKATSLLVQNEFPQALALLDSKDAKAYVAAGLSNQYYLCRARILVAENRFEEALRDFQAVSSSSDFYIEALEETSWVFFKLRRFESAQVLLDVLIGNYESGTRGGSGFHVLPSQYYRSRYLKAYMALVEQRTEGAAAEFADLKNDYEKFREKTQPSLETASVLEAIRVGNAKWSDIRALPPAVSSQLDMVSEWIGPDSRKDLENQLHFQMALSREWARVKQFGAALNQASPGYSVQLEKLHKNAWQAFSRNYAELVGRVSKGLKKMGLKAELGRLEIVWMNRAQGARNLDEIIDNYQMKIRSVEEFTGQ